MTNLTTAVVACTAMMLATALHPILAIPAGLTALHFAFRRS